MLICGLALYAAATEDVASLLQLRQNVTASSNTLEAHAVPRQQSEGAALRALGNAVSERRTGGDGAAASAGAGIQSEDAAATLTAAASGHRRHEREGGQRASQRAQRLRARLSHQYQGWEVGSLFDEEVPSADCSYGAALAAAKLVDEINVIRHNLDYRVGDVLKKGGFFWRKSREHLMTAPYEGTALQRMLKPCADRGELDCDLSLRDLGDTLESIGQDQGFATPDERTIVAYLRAGDVVGPCEDNDGSVHNYNGDEVAAGLRDPKVTAKIGSAMARGYNRLNFVVVESYADRADAGEHGYWMYTDAKHEENKKQLREAFEDVIGKLCAGGEALSFGVASFVNVDETLYYMMHAATLVGERARIVEHGFPWIALGLKKAQNASASIILPDIGPSGYPACSGNLGKAGA